MISKRPWMVTVAPGVVGWRSVTFVTVPLPPMTHTPRCRLRANSATLSHTSWPLATSRTCGRMALPFSRVMMTGGLGLFLDPGGRPRGLRDGSPGPGCGFRNLRRLLGLPGTLLPLPCSSSEPEPPPPGGEGRDPASVPPSPTPAMNICAKVSAGAGCCCLLCRSSHSFAKWPLAIHGASIWVTLYEVRASNQQLASLSSPLTNSKHTDRLAGNTYFLPPRWALVSKPGFTLLVRRITTTRITLWLLTRPTTVERAWVGDSEIDTKLMLSC